MNDARQVLVDPASPDRAALELAAGLLRTGGLVVSPTETRYGLLARCDDPAAMQRMMNMKGRSALKPTALFVANVAQMSDLGDMNSQAAVLARCFLPGPLTLVLKSRTSWKAPVVVDGKIGLRCSSSSVIEGIIEQIDFPCTATSANLAGGPDLETVDEIRQLLGAAVDLYLDAGPLSGPASTVVDCTGPRPVILREGSISRRAIAGALQEAGA